MGLGSVWGFFVTHKSLLTQLLVGVVLFGTGWQLGRVMSPYYAAHPIVFEDRECAACSSSGGSQEALLRLQQEGEVNTAIVTPVPAVAGTSDGGGGESTPPVLSDELLVASDDDGADGTGDEHIYVASKNSDLFHHRDCSSWKRIKNENQIWFSSVDEASAAGYSPSKCTQGLLGP